jgi:predicted Zn-dependent protease
MGINQIFADGFLSFGRKAVDSLSKDATAKVDERASRIVSQSVERRGAEVLGRDVFKASPALKKAAAEQVQKLRTSVDPMAVIGAAENKYEAGMLKGLTPAITAEGKAGEQELEKAFGQIADQATPEVPVSLDKAIGDMQMAEAAKETPEVNGKLPELTKYIQGVLDRLSDAAGVEKHQLHILQTEDVNAFNAGGPSMAVLTGLLPYVNNEAELAGVMAHEMTHGIKRHVIQGVVRQEAVEDAGKWVAEHNPITEADMAKANELISKLSDEQKQNIGEVMKALKGKVSPEVMAQLEFEENTSISMAALQRANESEADAGAARILSKAGYDPNALSSFFKRLPEPEGDARFFDHPTNAQRISDLDKQIATEKLAVGKMETNADAYKKALELLKGADKKTA